MKKAFCFLLTVFLLSTIIGASVFGQEPSAKRVSDRAGVLSSGQADALESRIASLAESLGFDIAVATVESLDGKSAQDYADDFYDSQGYGAGPGLDGILLLVSIGDREWRASTSGRCMDIFTSRRISAMGAAMSPCMSEGDFGGAFEVFLDMAAQYAQSPPDARDAPLARSRPYVPYVAAVGISLAVSLAAVLVMKAQMGAARPQRAAGSFIVPGSFKLARKADVFLWSHVAKTPLAPPPGQSGGGGGSHVSSSGRTHGGGGGKF
jgi:uncharacterized protein